MDKNQVIRTLREMADLLEITQANPFEIRGVRNAAQSLDEWEGDLKATVDDQTLTEIPMIGKKTAAVITDLVSSGTSSEVDRVRGLVPDELPRLLRFRGLGPKRVRTLWTELGIESPDDLKAAADSGKVQTLKGFGPKMIEKIYESFEYFAKRPEERQKTMITSAEFVSKARESTGKIWAGISGYSFPEWKGSFYPADAKTDELLKHYSAKLGAVEINNTFYRFPAAKVVAQWKDQTPEDFCFALKAHRQVTHQQRLSPASRVPIVEFVERASELGGRLGCVLFQFPPDFARDDDRLDLLLDSLPDGPRYALEFRHESWLDDAVQDKLRTANIALVAGDDENEEPCKLETADFVYIRLRRAAYSEADLAAWDKWINKLSQNKKDVFLFMKHDDKGSVPEEVVNRWR